MRANDSKVAHLRQFFDDRIETGFWPSLGKAEVDEEKARLELSVPSNLGWFDGHFPDQPVLPGIVQIHWAALVGAELYDRQANLNKMSRLKFATMVLPDTLMTLDLKLHQSKDKLSFKYHLKDQTGGESIEKHISSGTLLLN